MFSSCIHCTICTTIAHMPILSDWDFIYLILDHLDYHQLNHINPVSSCSHHSPNHPHCFACFWIPILFGLPFPSPHWPHLHLSHHRHLGSFTHSFYQYDSPPACPTVKSPSFTCSSSFSSYFIHKPTNLHIRCDTLICLLFGQL